MGIRDADDIDKGEVALNLLMALLSDMAVREPSRIAALLGPLEYSKKTAPAGFNSVGIDGAIALVRALMGPAAH